MIDGDSLVVHTIYFNTADFPGLYVGRAWITRGGEPVPEAKPFVVARTLNEAREAVPPASDYRLPREPHDDPVIVESWV